MEGDIMGWALQRQDIYLVSQSPVSERQVAYILLRDAETVRSNSESALRITEFPSIVRNFSTRKHNVPESESVSVEASYF
jgi:hypothetical protein